jgi:hypothetical protein
MRFIDGELAPAEHARVEAAIKADTELNREASIFRAMKGDFQELSFHPGEFKHSVWDTVNESLTRPVGWMLVIVGTAIWTGYGGYVFATSSADPFEKLATGAVVIGILMLLASVIWERYHVWLTDPYRDVYR